MPGKVCPGEWLVQQRDGRWTQEFSCRHIPWFGHVCKPEWTCSELCTSELPTCKWSTGGVWSRLWGNLMHRLPVQQQTTHTSWEFWHARSAAHPPRFTYTAESRNAAGPTIHQGQTYSLSVLSSFQHHLSGICCCKHF